MKSKFLFLAILLALTSLHAEVKTSLKKFVSSECNTLIGIDMKSLLAIKEIDAYMKSSENDQLKQMNELGLKPQDIESVIIGLNSEKLASDPMSFEKEPELISISHVKDGVTFDRLIEAAKGSKVETKIETIDGTKAAILTKDGKEFVMVELAEKTIAVGSRKMVQKALALKGGASTGSINDKKALADLAQAQKGIFWVIGAKPEAKPAANAEGAPLDNPMNSLFGSLKMFTLSLAVNEKEMKLHSDLICKDPAGADQLAMTAQLMTGFLAANEDSPVKADQIKFSKNNETLSVNVSIDKQALMKTLEAAQGLAE